MAIVDQLRSLFVRRSGIERYDTPQQRAIARVNAERLEVIRQKYAGRTTQPQISVYARYLDDVEQASRQADAGSFEAMARIGRYVLGDGYLAGLLEARSAGIARLPKVFMSADTAKVATLQSGSVDGSQGDSPISLFDSCVAPSELALFAADAFMFNMALGELVWSRNSDVPRFKHHDLESLSYDLYSNSYYFLTPEGKALIEPGLGRWVLFTGTAITPHQRGKWRAVGINSIRKELCQLNADNYSGKTANPARVGYLPAGASPSDATDLVEALMAWGVDSCFALPNGWRAELLESTGTTHEVFKAIVEACNIETQLILCGSTIPATGGAGFSNTTIHELVRGDLIASAAQDLSQVINDQILPAIVVGRWGAEALEREPVSMTFDSAPPSNRAAEAQSLISAAQAVTQLQQIYGERLDTLELATRFSVPLLAEEPAVTETPVLKLVPDAPAEPIASPAAIEEKPAADSALNGAQVTSLVEIVKAVAAREIPRDAAVGIIQLAYLIDERAANKLLGSVGQSFKPALAEVASAAE